MRDGAINRAERVFLNQDAARSFDSGSTLSREPLAFHQRMAGYAPTPLVDAPTIARRFGCDRVWIKTETERFGLPAFKIMGASWATYRVLLAELERRSLPAPTGPATIDELKLAVAPLRPLTLTCATDGNHGRAVARMARLHNLGAHVFVPAEMDPARIAAIAGEGADVTKFDGTYDDAVAQSAAAAGERCLVISDTAWPGYHDVPSWVIEGYSSIFWEVDDELEARGERGPTFVAVQIGVGALAAAVVRHFRRSGVDPRPFILGIEPTHAACVLRSMEAGVLTRLPGPHDSIMAGLNAGLPSEVAWPLVSAGIDAFVAVDDHRAYEGIELLAADGVAAGETGAAGLAGVLGWRNITGRDFTSERLLLICTEGQTGTVTSHMPSAVESADSAEDGGGQAQILRLRSE
ncbi:MAG: diaminopropionate ammonia-lyase [Thermomicrobiales bacterium]